VTWLVVEVSAATITGWPLAMAWVRAAYSAWACAEVCGGVPGAVLGMAVGSLCGGEFEGGVLGEAVGLLSEGEAAGAGDAPESAQAAGVAVRARIAVPAVSRAASRVSRRRGGPAIFVPECGGGV
jgi:hypothetical protein